MEMHLPRDVQDGLDAARKAAQLKSHRLRVEAGGVFYRILRAWPGGFAVDAADAPHLGGLVDLYDGSRHLSRGLIVAAVEEAGEWHFDYKRMTDASASQPADFARAPDAPAGLLEHVARRPDDAA
ncbi:hypothetical protein [Roseovarius sp. Pro17]|uniref:hypothetical protein n=1 Tax=Roseovarius sp. Pro17 TaxID=3108175 RepID=UPI002D79C7F8|nr:hypothetical protein [Roseovarius sp. Pro17]